MARHAARAFLSAAFLTRFHQGRVRLGVNGDSSSALFGEGGWVAGWLSAASAPTAGVVLFAWESSISCISYHRPMCPRRVAPSSGAMHSSFHASVTVLTNVSVSLPADARLYEDCSAWMLLWRWSCSVKFSGFPRPSALKLTPLSSMCTTGSSTLATETGPCFFGENRTMTRTLDSSCAHCTAGTTCCRSSPLRDVSFSTALAPSLIACAACRTTMRVVASSVDVRVSRLRTAPHQPLRIARQIASGPAARSPAKHEAASKLGSS
mmetsp:Transcript_2437/g.5105  ORF Transcript_2437/g.5105 Transcript_2437/m.5105 type:complete len:265 (+) Transcript_2437:302-1096(+)